MARLEVQWMPAVGAARYEIREQGPGSTPVERFRNGIPLGPRVDSTRFIFTGAELRDYQISVRAYNRAGVGSPEPSEITVNTNLRVEGSRVPSDIDLLVYMSWDEHTDQNGDLVEPTVYRDQFGPPVAPVGSAERRRRLHWDQGRTGNTMFLEMDIAGDFNELLDPKYSLPTTEKSGPCNHHIQMGDTVPSTVAARKTLFGGLTFALVDRRTDAAVNGQTEMDLSDNVTFIQWINPCLMWIRGETWSLSGGQQYQLWTRISQLGLGDPFVGYMWVLGGPPFWSLTNDALDMNPGVNGFTFVYFTEGGTDILDDGNALFWAYPWEQGFDSSDGGDLYPVDAGEYVGWLYCALTIGPKDSNGNCEFTQWVGQADQDNLISLGTQSAPAMSFAQWAMEGVGGSSIKASSIMTAINDYLTSVNDDDSGYENIASGAHFAKFDESRIYARTLSDAEIRGLYDHPGGGGQKRAENVIEPLRQAQVP